MSCMVVQTRRKRRTTQTIETDMRPFTDFQPVHGGSAIYQQLADEIQRRVSEGELKAGDRLPPQREFARLVGVNVTTITRAFATLHRRGLVSSRPGRGSVIIMPNSSLACVSAPEVETVSID